MILQRITVVIIYLLGRTSLLRLHISLLIDLDEISTYLIIYLKAALASLRINSETARRTVAKFCMQIRVVPVSHTGWVKCRSGSLFGRKFYFKNSVLAIAAKL